MKKKRRELKHSKKELSIIFSHMSNDSSCFSIKQLEIVQRFAYNVSSFGLNIGRYL